MIDQAVVHHRQWRRAGERRLAGEHLVQHHAYRIQVRPCVSTLAPDLLRGDVVGAAQGLGEARVGQPLCAGLRRNAKVNQLEVVVRVKHDVLGLQIAVHHAILVDIVQRTQYPQRDFERPRSRHLALLEHHLAQQAAIHPLHHHIHPRPLVVGVDAHYIGVVEREADCLLALEAVEEGRVGLHGKVRDLQRYLAAVPQVGCPVDGCHPTLGYGFVNAVVVKFLAGCKSCGKTHGLAFIGPNVAGLRY